MQLLVKVLLNSFCIQQIIEDIEERFTCKSDYWMLTEYGERVRGYWKISHGIYFVKMVDDKGLEDEVRQFNTMALHLGSFVLSNSRSIMKNFTHSVFRIYTSDLSHTDTDSLGIESKHWDKIDEAGWNGNNFLQGKLIKKMLELGFVLFLAPKINYCSTINKNRVIDEHKTFKGFTNVSNNSDKKNYFKMLDGNKTITEVPLSWRKSFSMGVVIPHKLRNCLQCKNNSLFFNCDILVDQNKEFSANFNELKRQTFIEYGHRFLW